MNYRQYASLSPNGDIWCLQQGVFLEMVHEKNITEPGKLTDAEVDIKFTATVSAQEIKGNFRNPERGIIRFQFLESVARLAEQKFVLRGATMTWVEAMDKFLEELFGKNEKERRKYDQQQWREQRLWNEECDDVLKFYKVLLDSVYNRYSIRKRKPGQKNFMSLEEFAELCRKGEMFEINIGEKEIYQAFNLSMMTQVDELFQDRIFQMSFVEFIEAVARVAEKCALQPYYTEKCALQPYYEQEQLPLEQRINLPLHLKLESLLIVMWNTFADAEVRAQLTIPKESLFKPKEAEDEEEEAEF